MNASFQLGNAYLTALLMISENPYFLKYVYSAEPRAVLTRVVTERFVLAIPRWLHHINAIDNKNNPIKTNVLYSFWLLGLLLLASSKLHINTIISKALNESLEKILIDYTDALAYFKDRVDGFTELCQIMFTMCRRDFDPDIHQHITRSDIGDYKRGFLAKRWNGCGLPSCENRQNLKACAWLVVFYSTFNCIGLAVIFLQL